VAEEGEGCEPDVVALDGERGEFEGTLGSEDEDGAVEGGGSVGAFRHGVVIFHVKDGLDGDWKDGLVHVGYQIDEHKLARVSTHTFDHSCPARQAHLSAACCST
jgi:hypothetical protein